METNVSFDFGSEIFKDIMQRGAGSLAKAAVGHLHQIFAQVGKNIQVRKGTFTLSDTCQNLKGPLRANTARVALPAAFTAEEIEEDAGHIHHAGIFIAD